MYDFCQNDGEVIETEDETPLYESEEDQEQVGCDIFYKDFVSRNCAITIRRRRPVVKRKGRLPLLIPYSHQLNVFY